MRLGRYLCALLASAACAEEGGAPEGRVMTVSVPQSEADARRAGCFSSGRDAGAGAGAWFAAAGAPPWEMTLRAYPYRDPSSTFSLYLLPSDGAFHDLLIDGENWVDGYADILSLPAVTIFEDYAIAPVLEGATFSGKIYPEELGLSADVVLSGYLPRARVREEVEKFFAACAAGSAPKACERAVARAEDAASIEAALWALSGGWDAGFRDGVPSLCSGEDCDAISVCLLLSASPIPD